MRIRAVSRGGLGGDAVYCAAYRGGRSLWNERTGDLYKWDGREDVRDVGIVLPQAHANDPEYAWAKDPYKLWNAAEFAEVQHNSRVARDYMMILPEELTAEQRRDVVYRFAQMLADRYDNAIDVALHDKRTGRARYYHAHLMGTARTLGPQGLLQKTNAEIVGRSRDTRQLTNTYADEYRDIRKLWEHTLQSAIREAPLPRQVYDTLYRKYGKGETTGDYHKRIVTEGYDLRKQQREDRRKTLLTPEERQRSAEKKWAIRKYRQLQNKTRHERVLANQRAASRKGAPQERRPDHNKKLFIPRWDVRKGLLNPWEVEHQIRTKGQPQATFPLIAKAGSEPEFEPEPEPKAAEPKQERPDLKEEPHQPARDMPAPSNDPVREWLAEKLLNKPDDERETQALKDGPAHTFMKHRDRELDLPAPRPVLDWIADKAIQTRDNASEAQHVRDWLDMRLKRQQNDAPSAASEIAREWLASRQPQESIHKEDEKQARGGPSYDLDR
jgi:hypothetical protein